MCDDGGTDSAVHVCAYGTDCTDCGTRVVCSDDCSTSDDGECDDGLTPNEEFGESGAESATDFCESGTDCSDCGSRY